MERGRLEAEWDSRETGRRIAAAAPGGFFSEEKRHADHEIVRPIPDVPWCRLTSTCTRGRYRIEKEVITDGRRL